MNRMTGYWPIPENNNNNNSHIDTQMENENRMLYFFCAHFILNRFNCVYCDVVRDSS